MPWYGSLPRLVKTIWPQLLRHQYVTLALLVELIIRQRSLCLTDLARGNDAPTAFASRYQQLWRWTKNDRIDSRLLRRQLAHHALAWRGDWGQYMPIIIDGTACKDFRILQAVIPRKTRGIPLLWHSYRHGTMRKQLARFETAFLDDLHDLLTEIRQAGITPVVIGDRGFAHQRLIRWCEQHGWGYLVRLPKQWRVKHRLYHGALADFEVKAGQARRLCDVACGPRRSLRANLVVTKLSRKRAAQLRRRTKKAVEAWYLLTNTEWTAPQVVNWYRKRWWIECSFRDGKQHLGLTKVGVTTVAALDRLLLAWMLALQLLFALGLKVITAAHLKMLSLPKRLGRVAQALAFLERHERLRKRDDPGRPLDLWSALWAGNPPYSLVAS